MPAWWGRKSSKTKEEPEKQVNLYSNRFVKPAIKNNDCKKKDKDKATKSFDQLTPRGSPRASKEFGTVVSGSSTGFSGFDSDGGSKGHPLPRPSPQGLGNDHGTGLGSVSGSVSSGSSSVSSDDQPIVHDPGQFAAFRLVFFEKSPVFFGLGLLLNLGFNEFDSIENLFLRGRIYYYFVS